MNTSEQQAVERFEANMLDGDKINDCGGAMISAKECLEYILSERQLAKQEILQEVLNKSEIHMGDGAWVYTGDILGIGMCHGIHNELEINLKDEDREGITLE